mgnify:FL=1
MDHLRRQQQLRSSEGTKITGQTRSTDLSVQANRTSASLSTSIEDQNFINKMLAQQKMYEDDIPTEAPSSEEFGEAFLNANLDSNKHGGFNKEDKKPAEQQEKDSDSSSHHQQNQVFQLEEDEVMDLSLEEQIVHRIMVISESLDRKTGEPASLNREIEKRLGRIATFIDKKPGTPTHQTKLFPVPSSTRVQKLRSKFGRH